MSSERRIYLRSVARQIVAGRIPETIAPEDIREAEALILIADQCITVDGERVEYSGLPKSTPKQRSNAARRVE